MQGATVECLEVHLVPQLLVSWKLYVLFSVMNV